VISCYNCHFESQLEHVKRARTKIRDFMLLVNREKDGKVHPAAFQSLTYQDTAFVAYGPYTPHNITSTGRQCDDCHANEHITEYMANGELKFVTFDEGTDTLAVLKGVVPIPVDYATTFKMDFITYDGNADDPLPGDGGWSSIGKDVPDGQHMLYATPLSEHQLEMLSLDFGSMFMRLLKHLCTTRGPARTTGTVRIRIHLASKNGPMYQLPILAASNATARQKPMAPQMAMTMNQVATTVTASMVLLARISVYPATVVRNRKSAPEIAMSTAMPVLSAGIATARKKCTVTAMRITVC
jgi:hypothetical protein